MSQSKTDKKLISLSAAVMCSCVIGYTEIPATILILAFALLVFFNIASKKKARKQIWFGLAFLLYAGLSALLFNGFDSAIDSDFIEWISGEGRLFLYFWPALYIIIISTGKPAGVASVDSHLNYMVGFYATCVAVQALTDLQLFSTHHAAGAVGATLVLYMFFRYESRPNIISALSLLVATVALAGSNSRTSLLACAAAILVVSVLHGSLKTSARLLVVCGIALVAMPILFSYEFDRLRSSTEEGTLESIAENYSIGLAEANALEILKAWEISKEIDVRGNPNIAIRGYLWGRATGEWARSPVLGIGFGRFNDVGRQFAGQRHFLYPVVFAKFNAPTSQTAHNTYLHNLSELGLLGSAILVLFFDSLLIRKKKLTLIYGKKLPDHISFWLKINQSSLLLLLLIGITQHSIGAPIYGLSVLAVLAFSYDQLIRMTIGPREDMTGYRRALRPKIVKKKKELSYARVLR